MHHHGQTAWIARLLGQVKVGQHNVPGLVQQNVYSHRQLEVSLRFMLPTLWLQVAVNKSH